ncbi:molecular chaperone DnaJ [Histomonas meleagridis]|uniref:molecular chaperone DnaJ n=1 Tax=Histomonas meleagridis TaxID=135588 RepID=UPI00355A1B7A|nr:molecular chaperone DnaJ [Histomonas meleagridis]KAH0802429.1 molecular chaperone DnaJ [Histomonas meleagridis]
MFLLFLTLISSTLKPGENPYEILGVKRTATDEEIRKAFRDITKKYHPDISKEENAEKIWVHANDAYELLHDPERRRIYDQTGSVAEDPSQPGYQGSAEDIFNQFFHFGFHQSQSVEMKTQEINFDNYLTYLKESGEFFVFIYNSRDPFNTPRYAQFFESIADEFEKVTTFVHNNAFADPRFAVNFKVRSAPRFVYLKLNNDGSILSRVSGNIRSRESFIKWMINCWNPDYKVFDKYSSLRKWLKTNERYTCVISVERGNEPSMEFKRLSSIYTHCKFAVLIDDYIKAIRSLKITEFPANYIIRGGVRVSTHKYSKLTKLSNPLFLDLSYNMFNELCKDICLIYIGDINKNITKKFAKFNTIPLMHVKKESSFAKQFGNENWALISSGKMKYKNIKIENLENEIKSFNNGKINTKDLSKKADWTFRDISDLLLKYAKKIKPKNLFEKIQSFGVEMEFPFSILLFLLLYLLLRFISA